MAWMFFLFGLVSLTGQIVLLREILVIFHGTEISIGIFFAVWLTGIGVGASCGARLVKVLTGGFRAIFLHSIVVLVFLFIAQILLIRSLPVLLRIAPAELAPLSGIFVAVPIGILGTAFLTGFLFPVGCKAVEECDDRLIARFYVFEALGSFLGGLALTFVLLRFIPPLRIAALAAILVGVVAGIEALRLKLRGPLVNSVALFLAGIVLVSPMGSSVMDWSTNLRWASLHPGLQLLASQATPYQQVEMGLLGKQYSLFGNGKIVASFPDTHSAARLAALVVAQKPDVKRLFLIGGGIGSLVGALLQYPIERLDIVEPDPWALEIASQYLSASEKEALQDSRVRVIFGDGRFYVNRLGRHEYDVVVCMVPDPVSSFWNRYYTREFFEAVFKALTPKGILVTGVTSAENFWGPEVASYAGSVYHTLKAVFPSVHGTPGDFTLFFASPSEDVISLNPEVLKARYHELGKHAFDPEAFVTILPPRRTEFVSTELQRSPIFINTDLTPISSALAMVLWGRFSGSEWIGALNTIRRGGLTVYLIPIVFFLAARVAFRARWGPREGAEARFLALLTMTAIGAGAMGSQIVLIYSYQSLFGYVFERIGLMAGLFMVGLGAGGWFSGRVLRRILRKDLWLAILLILFVLFCLSITPALTILTSRDPEVIEAVICSLVLISGIISGISFPLVASRHLEFARDAGISSGWTDAVDHFGAALGAALTGVFLVPLLGIRPACLVLAMILIAPATLILADLVFSKFDTVLARFRARGRVSFPYVRLSWFLVFVVTAAMTWHLLIGPPGRSPVLLFQEAELKQVSGSEGFTFQETPFPHYVGKSESEPGITISLSTMNTAGEVRGYGGPINLLLSVSEAGIIRGIRLVESRETPSYIKGLDEWLARFRGRSILGPLHSEVDALTGATITARAVTDVLTRTGSKIAGPLLGLPEPRPVSETEGHWERWVKDVRLWAVALVLLVFVVAFFSRSRHLRTACLLISLIILGLWLNAPFSCLDAVGLFKGEVPAAGIPWRSLMFLAVVMISILWGQAFCGFACPFGALQEFLSVRRFRRRASPAVEQAGRYVKYVLLAGLLSLALITDDTVWFYFSPLQHFFRLSMDEWVLALSIVCLAASTVYFRFWCRYLCPAGAFLALFNKVNLLRRWSPKPIPARCDLGVSFPQDVDCIRCHRCLFETATGPRKCDPR